MAALVDFVEIGEARVDRLAQLAGGPDLAGERREADGNRDRRRGWPLRASGQRPCASQYDRAADAPGAGQPVQRDVVEDVCPG